MNRVLIEINTINAAFREHGGSVELTRILLELTHDIQDHGVRDRFLYDINGNVVGEVTTN